MTAEVLRRSGSGVLSRLAKLRLTRVPDSGAGMFAFRTMIAAALLAAAASCPSPVVAESQVNFRVTIPARAPHFPGRVSIRRLPDDADRKQVANTHRMFLTLRTPSWRLAAPTARRAGGYRLRGAPRRGDRQRLPRSPARPGRPGIRDSQLLRRPAQSGEGYRLAGLLRLHPSHPGRDPGARVVRAAEPAGVEIWNLQQV